MIELVAPVDAIGRILLHGGGHSTPTPSAGGTVHWSYMVASVAFVGVVGGALYWYLGHRT